MKPGWLNVLAVVAIAAAALLLAAGNYQTKGETSILNVSYAPTGELLDDLDQQFVAKYQNETGKRLVIQQSHGGSSRQARAVANGLEADVVTLALPSDIDLIAKHGLIAPDWAARLPNHSQPYFSTVVFVVRKGNPCRA